MVVKKGYKQTEVGVIPEDWHEVRVNDLEPFITSGSRGWARYYSDRGELFIRITNMSRATIYLDLEDPRFVKLPTTTTREGARTCVQNGDLLVSVTADIGIISWVSSTVPKPAYINQHIALVRLPLSHVDSKFTAYFLASSSPQKRFRAITDQGAKAGINLATVRDIPLAFPPTLAEQEAIAGALSDADAWIESLEQLIAKKRQIKQGAMQELLTGKRRLPGFSGEWETKRLGDIVTADWGNTTITKDSYENYGYPAYSASGQDGYVSWYEHDGIGVVISAIGAQCGKSWLARKKWTPIKNTIWFKAINDSAITEFLYWKTCDRDFWPKSGQAQPFVSVGSVRNAKIELPENTKEQTAIATVLSDMDTEIESLESKLAKAREIKQGMMKELLTGKTRL
jgi:type I restriction enzyme S subunit